MTKEEVEKIYYEEYIGQHIGTQTLKQKYNCHIYDLFRKYKLPIRSNQEKNKKYTCNINYFHTIDTEEKAYWLGFLMADGYINKGNGSRKLGISINETDKNHLEKFKTAINATHPVKIYEVKQGYKIGTKYCRLMITEETLVQDLIDQGCVEHKSNILQPPNIRNDLRRHWIRGFMDGNGSIVIHNTRHCKSFCIGFVSTDDVLNWIMDVLIQDNVITRRYQLDKRKSGQIVSAFQFGGNYLVKKYCDYIYKDATVYLDRKYERYLQLCNILDERDKNKIKHCCDICGNTNSSGYFVWHGDDIYNGKVVCRTHWEQLHNNGAILPSKKEYCEICGDTYGRMIQCGKKYMEYYGITMCRRHYEQISVYGKITNLEKGEHKNVT